MVNFKDMSAEQLEASPPSYDTMVKTIQSRVKAKVKRAMPRIRGKVAALGKAKVKEKKKVAKKIAKTAETATAIRKRAQLEVKALSGRELEMAKAGMIDKDTTTKELRLLSQAYKGFGFTFADLLNLSEQIQKGKKKPISLEKLLYPKGLSPRDRREGVVIGEQRLARDKLIRAENKKRKKEGKKEIIKGIKKIGATELAKKKAAGVRISVKAKMPSIQKKVAKLGKAKAKEKRKVGKAISRQVKAERREGAAGRTASKSIYSQGLRREDKRAIDFANEVDFPTQSVFINSLTDTVINPESGNIVGTMYGGIFAENMRFYPDPEAELNRESSVESYVDPEASSQESYPDPEDTDTESEAEDYGGGVSVHDRRAGEVDLESLEW